MQSLQQQATGRSGVKEEDAFAIDEVNLYQKLGHQTFVNLSTEFYNRVYADEEPWFRSIFANSTKEEAIQNQYEFFIQRMGHPALIGRHAPYAITEQAAERWLHHMEAALHNVERIDPDPRNRMLNFFRHTAYFLVAGKEMMNSRRSPANNRKQT
ncbi:hypothetical protein O6H91_06G138300 [Diphasiastrum complanatum]|uniref:Uncharacterized protein n=1 Tax=Diphasiastrum complanatum TaxID=34168 RepID=A0ACC2DJQ1_DIPCM|nr:hypothetical protein O6H91_06G138300 [Diphasiastrum complanatum]